MPISTLRDDVQTTLVEFAWSQWGQMGVFASTDRRDSWAQDPEALLVFTLHVARREPRLFDEVLDWLRLNGRLVSGRRLASLCPPGDEAGQLVEAAVDWARANGSSVQIAGRHPTKSSEEQLFESVRVAKPDEVFRSHGYLKPATEPSFNSREPDLRAPINLAFRLRQHFGLASSRAEIVRFLLTSGVLDANALAIADAAGYAKRNVNETLAALAAAGDVERYVRGNEGRYSVDRARWAEFLGTAADELPIYRDWPRLLLALRKLDRWLHDAGVADLSDYMRASEARALMGRLEPTLTAGGVLVSRDGTGADYWSTFEQNVARLLEKLSPTARSSVESTTA
jgi:DNA-binding transcriptional ArsR family regulator